MVLDWMLTFRKDGCMVMSNTYALFYSLSSVKRCHPGGSLKNVAIFVIATRVSKTQLNTFSITVETKTLTISSCNCCNGASKAEMKWPKLELSKFGGKTPVRKTERCTSLVIDLIENFISAGGSLCYPYAQTLETAIAAIEIFQTCVSIKHDCSCSRSSIGRIKELSKAQSLTLSQWSQEHKR